MERVSLPPTTAVRRLVEHSTRWQSSPFDHAAHTAGLTLQRLLHVLVAADVGHGYTLQQHTVAD